MIKEWRVMWWADKAHTFANSIVVKAFNEQEARQIWENTADDKFAFIALERLTPYDKREVEQALNVLENTSMPVAVSDWRELIFIIRSIHKQLDYIR